MTARSVYVDDSETCLVVSCPACLWRSVSTDRIWARRALLAHLDSYNHPRSQTQTVRDSTKRWLMRNT